MVPSSNSPGKLVEWELILRSVTRWACVRPCSVAFCENLKRTVVSHHLQLPLVSTTETVSGSVGKKILYVHLFAYFTAWRLTRFIFCFSPECLFANNVLVTSLISCITPGVNIYEANKCILLKIPNFYLSAAYSLLPKVAFFFKRSHDTGWQVVISAG